MRPKIVVERGHFTDCGVGTVLHDTFNADIEYVDCRWDRVDTLVEYVRNDKAVTRLERPTSAIGDTGTVGSVQLPRDLLIECLNRLSREHPDDLRAQRYVIHSSRLKNYLIEINKVDQVEKVLLLLVAQGRVHAALAAAYEASQRQRG